MIEYNDLKAVNGQYMGEMQEALQQVLASGWYLKGEVTSRFERHYAEYVGVRHAIAVANGLDALALTLRAYMELGRLKEGDEVIVPANTYIATILAITENRLKPVFAEPDWNTLQIDDSLIENLITPRTKALMLVHLYGRCAYTDRIGRICKEHSLLLVEDNAQAHGCRYNAKRTGGIGDAAGHSFYPGKNLGALGDAGAVTTDDDDLAEAVRTIANYGSEHKYVFRYKGRNSRMDELQAAVLDVKLRHLDSDNRCRQEIAAYYLRNIRNTKLLLPQTASPDSNVYHIFPICCAERDRLKEYLSQLGIQTIIHYPIAPHKQECYKEYAHLSLPITERIHREVLSIPLYPTLSPTEQAYIVKALNGFV